MSKVPYRGPQTGGGPYKPKKTASRPLPPAQPVGVVPPCKGDPKGTGFCEFHECENDCQGPFEPVAAQPVGEPAFLGQICIHCALPWKQHGATTMSCPKGPTKFWPKASTIHLPREPEPAPQPVGEPEPEEHPRADCEGCFRPDCPCNMNEDWLDAELRANGIDPHKLNQKMLERIEQSIAEGHDTPRLHEAHAAFKKAVETPKPAPQATPNASFEEWATSRGMRLLKITEKAGYYYTRTRHAFEGWNAAQSYYEQKIADANKELEDRGRWVDAAARTIERLEQKIAEMEKRNGR